MRVARLEPPAPGVELLVLEGDLDIGTAPEVATRLDELTGTASRIVLDLTGLDFLDSAGVRLVDGVARRCAGQGGCLQLVAPPGNRALRVLQVLGLSDSLVQDDVAAAVAAVLDAD